jgi:glutathione S-transferase
VQLYFTPNSPYARKARIIIHELALKEQVSEVVISLPAPDTFRRVNPLGKIPALVLDGGTVIYDSPVICEYLDQLGSGRFFPQSGPPRWRALTLHALGDGLADAVVRRNQERRLPEERRSPEVLERQTKAIEAAFATLERDVMAFPEPTIGELAVVSAIGYLDLRAPEDGWRGRYPRLSSWLAEFSQRPSVQATKPPPA